MNNLTMKGLIVLIASFYVIENNVGASQETMSPEKQLRYLSDMNNFDDNEKDCFGKRAVWYKENCALLKSFSSCGKNERLYLITPGEMEGVAPFRPACKVNSCSSGDIFWPSLNRCESRSAIRKEYCNGEHMVVKINDFGDSVCTCTDYSGKMADKDDCFEFYQRGPCRENEVITLDKASGLAVCSPDLCHHNNSGLNGKRTLYAPMGGNGTCYELQTIGPCEDFDVQARFVVDGFYSIPACKIPNSLKAHVIDARLLCVIDQNKRCRKPVKLQQGDRETFVQRLQRQKKEILEMRSRLNKTRIQ